MRFSITVTIAAMLVSCASALASTPPSPRELERAVDAYLAPLRQCDLFQGAVLIGRGDRVLLAKGYGDANVELGVPNTPDHVFRIASLSKMLTEVALGRLMEQGKLSLSDPLSRFRPDFPRGDSITLDMLRNHRAGIPSRNSIPYDEEAWQPNTLDSLVRILASTPLDFAPGASQRYSNGGYAVLAAVIEKASGLSYASVIEREVATPLGLTSTRHESDVDLVTRRAYGYVVTPVRRHGLVTAPFQQMETKAGGGSLVSTVYDLHRFLRAMYTDRALRPDTWKTLFPEDSVHAFQGRCPGYNVYMRRDFTRDLDVIVLANNYASGMVADVGRDLIAIARGVPTPKPAWRADLPLDTPLARRAVGTYRIPPGLPYGQGPIGLVLRGGDLVVTLGGSPVDVLLPQSPGRFLMRRLWSEVRIEGSEGETPRVSFRPLWYEAEPVTAQRLP